MKLEIGILNLEAVKRFGPKVIQALDTAERLATETLKVIAGRKLSDELSGGSVKRRTGNLAQSAQASFANAIPRRDNDGWSVVLGYGAGPSARYANQIEYGGTIKPVNAKVLSIPLADALTAAGRKRYDSPLQVPGDAFWIKTKGGTLLFGTSDENDEFNALFVGKESVTQEGKFPAKKARDEAQSQAPAVFEAQIARALAAA